MTTGADIIAGKLFAAGCRHAFGIPGGEVLALMQSLDQVGMNFVLVKHENAGGFMAEGGWHADGAPGVLLATLGPGAANAVNVIANAWQDRVPLVFLTGCVDQGEAESYTHQVFDHQQLLRPIVKASFSARLGALDVMMEKALAIALDGQPGPVHIDVPIRVAEMETEEKWSNTFRSAPVGSAPAAGSELETAIDLFAKAERPIAIAGVDAVNEGASAGISEFCRKFRVPLVTSYKGKGLLDENHSLALGGAGLSPKADGHLLPLINASDCILLLGYDPIEMRINWRDPWNADANVIDVTPVLRTHGMHSVSATLRSATMPVLNVLGEARAPEHRSWENGEPAKVRQELDAAFAPEQDGWGPGTVFHTLRGVMPADTVATADSGAHRILASQIWRCPLPRQMLQSSALCTMGCAVPLAMGHRLVEGVSPVIAFVGDAGLEMCLGELSTLRDLKIPVIICVLVDTSLALIELKQRGSQRPNVGVDFGETDFPAVAQAYGGHGVWIDSADDLQREAAQALERDGFTVLACRISRRAYDGAF
ncbi:thiamine pyrophosphate-binding protein [Roseibium album]|uniref:Acetolactate synthase isozyme 3 large subunit n=1 Tax=Roseibium album TaxID=311410 RepID=A0A0M7A0D3_9HYPH|nr:thiamine pyrophosphate-binding protein [Roseibium album]CTQ61459.1 Acetolactate synthase isozyme 3 large subunit [Roseibium album]CTQ68349.1 Acetolactate synthase isozyme 3 large subunit [Roseibium album]CTQ79458.1 Acetolactate synthase isozyme 3 large subunit [Roseibium album]